MSKTTNVEKKPTKVKNVNELVKLIKINEENVKKFTVPEIVKVLTKFSDLYHNKGEPLVSDEIYDYIREYLEEIDPHNSFLSEIGAPIKGTKEMVVLPFPMGSLQKFKPDDGRLDKWNLKYPGPYIVSDKLDGASAQLWKSHDGKLYFYSRGDGIEGQDISHLINIIFSNDVLAVLPNGTSVRGELIISCKNFTEKLSTYMKNGRNAVAGLVNSKTVDNKVASVTDFVTYSILSPRMSQEEQLEKLAVWGFNVVTYKKFTELSDKIMSKYLTGRHKKLLYEMDGLVGVDDSTIYEHKSGFPDYMFAFKMMTANQMAEAIVTKISWELSRDGYIKPTITINPVKLRGVTVTSATAHNAKFIVDNKLGVGSKIKIIRSNDVIPYIMEVLTSSNSGEADMPEYEYMWNHTGVDLIVKKLEGSAKKIVTIKLLMGFFAGIGSKYLGEGIITKLVHNGYDSVERILNADHTELENIEGIGSTMVNNIYDEIDRAFNEISLVTFMSASHEFGRGLAEKKLEKILEMYPDILKKTWDKDEMIEKIIEVKGFDEKLATLFASNFQKFKLFYEKIGKIKDLSRFNMIKKITVNKNAKFTGMIFVFTGPRDKKLEKYLSENGGKIDNTVTKTTTYLIHDDNADKTSSKFEKAEKQNVIIMSNTEFKEKYKLLII
jgi:DNA ligase (NAD+)